MGAILLLALAAVAPSSLECRAMTAAVAQDAVIDAENTRAEACPANPPRGKLRYDRRAGVVRARGSIAAGESIGRAWLPARPAVLAGDTLLVTARLGVASVSRAVTALQSARPGERFFVTSTDGAIFAAPPLSRGAR